MIKMHISRREPGQIMVMFALALVGLLSMVALVIDGGYMYVQRRTAQSSADAAALAGTGELSRATSQFNSTVGAAVCQYAQANAFGITPAITHAYYVDTDGNKLPGADISLPSACGGLGGSTTIPWNAGAGSANGVHVDVNIPFKTFLAGMLGVVNVTAAASATGNVGIATAGDVRNAPFIVCGGVAGAAELITDITPGVVFTTVPQVLGATPAALPTTQTNGPPTVPEILLLPPAPGQPTMPAYYLDTTKDGHVYYIKGQHLGGSGGDCGVSGFKGGADPTQTPTDNWVNLGAGTPVAMVDLQGNKVPQINGNAGAPGACAAGTDPNNWNPGDPGCVMWLPIANGGNKPMLDIQAWGAFYVWCGNISSGKCQEFAGQYLSSWKGSGPSVNAWRAGTGGATIVVHLGQ
jgi:hypothetical protein